MQRRGRRGRGGYANVSKNDTRAMPAPNVIPTSIPEKISLHPEGGKSSPDVVYSEPKVVKTCTATAEEIVGSQGTVSIESEVVSNCPANAEEMVGSQGTVSTEPKVVSTCSAKAEEMVDAQGTVRIELEVVLSNSANAEEMVGSQGKVSIEPTVAASSSANAEGMVDNQGTVSIDETLSERGEQPSEDELMVVTSELGDESMCDESVEINLQIDIGENDELNEDETFIDLMESGDIQSDDVTDSKETIDFTDIEETTVLTDDESKPVVDHDRTTVTTGVKQVIVDIMDLTSGQANKSSEETAVVAFDPESKAASSAVCNELLIPDIKQEVTEEKAEGNVNTKGNICTDVREAEVKLEPGNHNAASLIEDVMPAILDATDEASNLKNQESEKVTASSRSAVVKSAKKKVEPDVWKLHTVTPIGKKTDKRLPPRGSYNRYVTDLVNYRNKRLINVGPLFIEDLTEVEALQDVLKMAARFELVFSKPEARTLKPTEHKNFQTFVIDKTPTVSKATTTSATHVTPSPQMPRVTTEKHVSDGDRIIQKKPSDVIQVENPGTSKAVPSSGQLKGSEDRSHLGSLLLVFAHEEEAVAAYDVLTEAKFTCLQTHVLYHGTRPALTHVKQQFIPDFSRRDIPFQGNRVNVRKAHSFLYQDIEEVVMRRDVRSGDYSKEPGVAIVQNLRGGTKSEDIIEMVGEKNVIADSIFFQEGTVRYAYLLFTSPELTDRIARRQIEYSIDGVRKMILPLTGGSAHPKFGKTLPVVRNTNNIDQTVSRGQRDMPKPHMKGLFVHPKVVDNQKERQLRMAESNIQFEKQRQREIAVRLQRQEALLSEEKKRQQEEEHRLRQERQHLLNEERLFAEEEKRRQQARLAEERRLLREEEERTEIQRKIERREEEKRRRLAEKDEMRKKEALRQQQLDLETERKRKLDAERQRVFEAQRRQKVEEDNRRLRQQGDAARLNAQRKSQWDISPAQMKSHQISRLQQKPVSQAARQVNQPGQGPRIKYQSRQQQPRDSHGGPNTRDSPRNQDVFQGRRMGGQKRKNNGTPTQSARGQGQATTQPFVRGCVNHGQGLLSDPVSQQTNAVNLLVGISKMLSRQQNALQQSASSLPIRRSGDVPGLLDVESTTQDHYAWSPKSGGRNLSDYYRRAVSPDPYGRPDPNGPGPSGPYESTQAQSDLYGLAQSAIRGQRPTDFYGHERVMSSGLYDDSTIRSPSYPGDAKVPRLMDYDNVPGNQDPWMN